VAYHTITTVQEYVLVAQDQPRVELYVKQGENQWLLTEYCGLDAALNWSRLGLRSPLPISMKRWIVK